MIFDKLYLFKKMITVDSVYSGSQRFQFKAS